MPLLEASDKCECKAHAQESRAAANRAAHGGSICWTGHSIWEHSWQIHMKWKWDTMTVPMSLLLIPVPWNLIHSSFISACGDTHGCVWGIYGMMSFPSLPYVTPMIGVSPVKTCVRGISLHTVPTQQGHGVEGHSNECWWEIAGLSTCWGFLTHTEQEQQLFALEEDKEKSSDYSYGIHACFHEHPAKQQITSVKQD